MRGRDLTGKAPEAYFQAMLQQFPKSGMNETARQLEELTTRLGIFNPMPNRLYEGRRKNFVGPFDTLDVPAYVLSQLRKPNDDIDEAPTKLQDYLKNHRADLDAIYGLVQQATLPRWETDVSATGSSACPRPALPPSTAWIDCPRHFGEDAKRQSDSVSPSRFGSILEDQPIFARRPELCQPNGAPPHPSTSKRASYARWKMSLLNGGSALELTAWQESFWGAMELDAVVISRICELIPIIQDPQSCGSSFESLG